MTLATSSGAASRAYADFADFYDRYVRDGRYAAWIDALVDAAARHGFDRGRALDVGCGTGLSTAPLLERCGEVVACEPVEAMARRAEQRLPDLEVHRAAATELAGLGAFDLVLMANDVVNYVPEAELDRAFERLAAHLAPAGVLVFDANTLATYREAFCTTDVRTDGDVLF